MYKTEFSASDRIWSGLGDSFVLKSDESQNFGDLILAKLAEDDVDRVIQIDGDIDKGMTKAEIRRQTIRCAQNLIKLGCNKDQRIAIIARNHHSLTPLLFAACCIGSPVCPLDVAGDANAKILDRIEPSFVFCDSDVLSGLRNKTNEVEMNIKLFTVNESVDGYDSIDSLFRDTGVEDSFECTKISDAFTHPAVIACSSGSTGISKSICISHAACIRSFGTDNGNPPLVSLSFSSLYWFSGLWATVAPAFKGTRIFTAKSFSTDIFFDLVEKYKVQQFSGAPCQVQSIVKSDRCKTADLSSLYACFSAGSSTPSILIETMKKIAPHCAFMTAYGMTEIGSLVSLTIPGEMEKYPDTVGQLMRGVEVKIINELTNERCGIGEEGEIYIKTTVPAMGYFRDEAANKIAFDKDGFFITGDIGYFDEAGRLFISGRKKEMFKVRNFVIWPSEIEDVIQKNPAVRYACVVNVYEDEIASDLAAAVVVKNEKHTVTEEEIYNLVADQLTNYKHLEGGVYFVDDLPLTPSGKVIRLKVKKMADDFYQMKKRNSKKQ